MGFLSPQDRFPFLESLRPPAGYRLDAAVGTTFSLDLLTLLVTPLGFTLFDLDLAEGDLQRGDPMELLEAIRAHADRITLFCQAGRISVPGRHRMLFTYLEPRVVQAKAPRDRRAFHPKLWVLRYLAESGEVTYRVLCLSRNLTFDRSWDTILCLDGVLRQDRVKGFAVNRPLGEFVRALPGMAVRPMDEAMAADVLTIGDEVERVEFDVPVPFEELIFWPLGHTAAANRAYQKRIDGRKDRSLVVSPFLATWALTRLAGARGPNILVSRQAALQELPPSALREYADRYAFTSRDTLHESEEPDELQAPAPGVVEPQGLHAKLLVLEAGKSCGVLTGSANATQHALDGNVEFMVELSGTRSRCGVDQFLAREPGAASFRDFLEPYESPPERVVGNPDVEWLEEQLESVRCGIAETGWLAEVRAGEGGEHSLLVQPEAAPPRWSAAVEVSCRPLSLQEAMAIPVGLEQAWPLVFRPLAFASLTSFLVFTVRGRRGPATSEIAFTINARLVNAPANRREQVLRHMLKDRSAVMRFLFLLLADLSDDPTILQEGEPGADSGVARRAPPMPALFEVLLRALARDESRLVAVERLLRELQQTPEGNALIPEGLTELFDAIWAARTGGSL